jgi:flagellar motility protein MotE (MotC chaperone)
MAQPRLVPIVMIAASALLGLKVIAFINGDFTVKAAEVVAGSPRDPFRGIVPDPIITGSGAGGGHGSQPAEAHSGGGATVSGHGDGVTPSQIKTDVTNERPDEAKPIPGSELLSEVEILKRLAERRKQLDKLEEELTLRENLLKATEEKVGRQVGELQSLEKQATVTVKDTAADQKKQFGDLAKMYEAMKPKDAARVFDGLDIRLLVDIARQTNPKKLADIVAKMSPEVAQKLTVELARPDGPPPPPVGAAALPKIQGRN